MDFNEIADEIINNEEYQKLKNYTHHRKYTTYDHTLRVAKMAYDYCMKKKKLKVDIVSVVRGALLHDFYLYDYHDNKLFTFHGYKHPRIALNTSKENFALNEKEEDIILKHMWPLTLFKMPKYRESWIVLYMDKKSSVIEFFTRKGRKNKND